MPPRANWKGFLKVAEVTTPVALYSAASSSARIALHTINRSTGHRVQRQYVDAETGAPVPAELQVKGYEVAKDEYVTIGPEEVAAIVPHGDKTIDVAAFIDAAEIDDLYFDRPYYLGPAEASATEIFVLLREGLRSSNVAAIGRAVLFRRVRTLLIRPYGAGLAAHTLNFDYQVRPAAAVFDAIPATKVSREALDLAEHIIRTKQGAFDPAAFHDRYEAALAELVKAKVEGKPIPVSRPAAPTARQDLLAALRESAGAAARSAPVRVKSKGAKRERRRPAKTKTAARRKAS